MQSFQHPVSITQVVVSALAVLVSILVLKLVRHRSQWRSLNLPGPPHSFLLGHLQVMAEYRARYKLPDQHMDYAGLDLTRDYGSVLWLDLWPFARPMCIVADPQIADRALRIDNMPKALELLTHDFPVLGKDSIVLLESTPSAEKQWKALRSGMAPGFRKSHLEKTWMPEIVGEIKKMMVRIEERCEDGADFTLMDYIMDATVEIILRITIGDDASSSLKGRITEILDKQLEHACTANLLFPVFDTINFSRKITEWHHTRQMDNLYKGTVTAHITAQQAGVSSAKPRKDVLDCLLLEQQLTFPSISAQIKTIVFGGHDTTSSSASWAIYYISTIPEVAKKLRQEVISVFGENLESIAGKIIEHPQILNDLQYANAIIKESLRMHPPAAGAREGPPDYVVNTKQGDFPLNGATMWICHYAIHRHPDNWEDPDTFSPERWLDEKGQAVSTPSAWMPFSKGPRNCVGLELALMEQRIILALAACKFDFEYAASEPPYQRYKLATRPSNGIPVRVRLRKG